MQPVPALFANMSQQEALRFTLSDLSIVEINFLLAGLQELPGKICNPISMKIRKQVDSQFPKQEPEVTK